MNEISSFFYYMWNSFSYDECMTTFAESSCGPLHIWNKWNENCAIYRGPSGAIAPFFAELDERNRKLLTDRALALYDGSNRRK